MAPPFAPAPPQIVALGGVFYAFGAHKLWCLPQIDPLRMLHVAVFVPWPSSWSLQGVVMSSLLASALMQVVLSVV